MGSKERRDGELGISRGDRRWITLCEMVREAKRRERIYGTEYSQGWQDAMAHMVRVMFPWHDVTARCDILNAAMREIENERA